MVKEEIEHKKKRVLYCFIAILIALLAYSVAQSAQDTADINNVFAPFLNNTNLAPQFPGEPTGTGERVSGVTYWANDSPIWLMAFAHAQTAAQTAGVSLFINGTLVEPSSGKPLGAAEEANKSIVGIIPKGANYSIRFDNFHHYEWREYPILSGKNGTLSLNSSVSDAQLNLKVNKTGDNITGPINISSELRVLNMTIRDSGTQTIINTTGSRNMLIQSNAFPGLVFRASAGASTGFPTIDNVGYIYPIQKTSCTGTNAGALCYNSTTNNLMLRNSTNWFNVSLGDDTDSSFNVTYDNTTNTFNSFNSSQSFPNNTFRNASNITTGELADARLSINIPRNDTENNFTQVQRFTTSTPINDFVDTDSTGNAQVGGIRLVDSAGTVTARIGDAFTTSQNIYITNNEAYGGIALVPGTNANVSASLKASAQTSAVCFQSTTGNITYNSGVTTCLASTDDVKSNISYYNWPVSERLKLLKPAYYYYKIDEKDRYGLIARDLVPIFPELVARNETGEITGIRYEELTTVLLKGFQEQQDVLNKICTRQPTLCQ